MSNVIEVEVQYRVGSRGTEVTLDGFLNKQKSETKKLSSDTLLALGVVNREIQIILPNGIKSNTYIGRLSHNIKPNSDLSSKVHLSILEVENEVIIALLHRAYRQFNPGVTYKLHLLRKTDTNEYFGGYREFSNITIDSNAIEIPINSLGNAEFYQGTTQLQIY